MVLIMCSRFRGGTHQSLFACVSRSAGCPPCGGENASHLKAIVAIMSVAVARIKLISRLN